MIADMGYSSRGGVKMDEYRTARVVGEEKVGNAVHRTSVRSDEYKWHDFVKGGATVTVQLDNGKEVQRPNLVTAEWDDDFSWNHLIEIRDAIQAALDWHFPEMGRGFAEVFEEDKDEEADEKPDARRQLWLNQISMMDALLMKMDGGWTQQDESEIVRSLKTSIRETQKLL